MNVFDWVLFLACVLFVNFYGFQECLDAWFMSASLLFLEAFSLFHRFIDGQYKVDVFLSSQTNINRIKIFADRPTDPFFLACNW